MIADLKRYAEYKESGLPWLCQVPAHWQTARSKRLFTPRKELARPDDLQLSATQAYGVIAQSLYEERTGYRVVKISMHLDKRRHVEANDFVISMRSFEGGLERAWTTGAIRSSYVVLKPNAQVDATYFRHLFKSAPYIGALRATADFIRDGQDLNYSNFCDVDLPLIPHTEQAAMGRFLDWANGRLEGAIRAKRKVIALLNEQKQAIIHRAVTRGLDPSVPLKPSGIPWLGDIPQHWEIRKLRHLTRQIIDGTHFTPNYRDDGVAFLRVTDIHEQAVDQSKLRRISKDEHLQLNKRCNPEIGDLLLSKNGTIGITKVVDWDFPFSIFVSLCLIKPIRSLVNPHFISFAFAGGLLLQQLANTTKTTSVTNLHLDKIRTLILPLPPLHEQSDILVKTRQELATIDTATSRMKREIELLREYRTRLVADVVTGKLDVREAAARLPDEAPLDPVEEDTDPSLDPEAADEEAFV